MIPEPFARRDIDSFLSLALSEKWVTDRSELEFLLGEHPEGCFCLREGTGAATGFVTSLRHGASAWIGNLLVEPGRRGEGIGGALFGAAMATLRGAGAETVWLTASAMGRPLYERRGFRRLDRIVRWEGMAGGASAPARGGNAAGFDADLDLLCWGDRRELLLKWAAARGRVTAEPGGCAVLQPVGGAVQIGPWAALDRGAAGRVLAELLSGVPSGARIVCDAPGSNRACAELLEKAGLTRRGETELMYAGVTPAYRPENLYGLATLGSGG